MTITDGRFEEETADAILDAMVADAKDYWDEELNDTSLNIIKRFYRPIAEQLAEAQSNIGLVLDSTQIDYASGKALDLLCALIGVSRQKAGSASGYVTFSRDTPAESVYIAGKGTEVQTDDSASTRYETIQSATLRLYDNFSDGDIAEYDGDKTDFNVQSDTVLEGSNSLEVSATSGVEVHNKNWTVRHGTDFRFYTQVGTGGISITEFSYRDDANTYQVVVDNDSGRVALEVLEGATKTVVAEDTSASVPAKKRVKVKVQWSRGGAFSLYFFDGADDQFASLSGDDTTHTSGGIGFKSGDANAAKYWDYFTATAIDAEVVAVESGLNSNTAPNTIQTMPDPPTGVEYVTNKDPVDGGNERENDNELRQRAKTELSNGSRASMPALYGSVSAVEGVTSVSLFKIQVDADETDDGFEVVAEGGDTQDIADAIFETMAAGDTPHGGINGTQDSAASTLDNGQTFTIEFSRPESIQIYVDADLTVADSFDGKDAVRDSIIDHIGGIFTSGNESQGLGAGEDVIFGEIEYQIRDVEGVYDVSNLTVDTHSEPDGTSNIAINDNQVSTSDGVDSSLTFETNPK
jgi:uncharacterized phage protein gp47/JayE